MKELSGEKYRLIMLALLLSATAIRVAFISSPPLSWRSADNAAMARNYCEGGMDFFRPRIDWGGTGSGIVQSEFPVYQYSVAVARRVLGESDAWGRLLSVLASAATILVMFVLVGEIMGPVAGLWSAFALAFFPLYAVLSQEIMAESAMLLFCALAVLSFHRWLAGRGVRWYWVFVAGASLAGLVKIVALIHLFFPVAFLAWQRHRWKAAGRPAVWMAAALVLVPVAAWYYYSGILLQESGNSLFGNWNYGTDKWGNWGMLASLKFWNRVVAQGVFEHNLGWIALIPFLAGITARRKAPGEGVFGWWLAGCLVYSVVVTYGSYIHRYYQVPYVLASSAVMARGFIRLSSGPRWRVAALAAAFALAGAWLGFQKMKPGAAAELVPLARMLAEKSAPGDLVVAYDEGNPRLLYLAHRKGWVSSDDGFTSGRVSGARSAGARWLAGRYPEPENPRKVGILRRQMRGWRVIYDNGRVFLAGAKNG